MYETFDLSFRDVFKLYQTGRLHVSKGGRRGVLYMNQVLDMLRVSEWKGRLHCRYEKDSYLV